MTDWPALIVNLLMIRDSRGMRVFSTTTLAQHVGCGKARISKLRQGGTEPLHSLGESLTRLHVRFVGAVPIAAGPVRNTGTSAAVCDGERA